MGLTAAGGAVLLLVTVDVFATVLQHWSGAGFLTEWVSRGVWRTARAATHRLPSSLRRRILGRVGPALIPVTLAVWALLVILGFALLHLPWMPAEFGILPGVPPPRTLADALYYSGVVFFTLGLGDLVSLSPTLRFLTLIEAGSGFALITLAISYFTSVYGAYSQQQVWADSLFFQSKGTADASVIIAAHLHGGARLGVLATELARLRDGVVRIRSDYASYPILHYFVSSRVEHSLLRLLFVLQDLVLLLDTAVDPRRSPDVAGLGGRSGLAMAVAHTCDSLFESIDRSRGSSAASDAAELADMDSWRKHFAYALQTLRGAGVPVDEGPEAVESYCRRRAEWEPVMRRSAALLGERWEDVTGDF